MHQFAIQAATSLLLVIISGIYQLTTVHNRTEVKGIRVGIILVFLLISEARSDRVGGGA